MNRHRGVRWIAAVVAVVTVMVFSGTVSVFASNADCLVCHETDARGQEFQVLSVDRDTACSACHVPGFIGIHPLHQPGSNCGAVCHDDRDGWGNSLLTAIPYYSDSAGAFSSATSKDTPASVLHIIHSTPRWPADIDTTDSRCASCHSVAACDACHVSDPSDTHATHGGEDPWSGTVCYGVTDGDQQIFSATPNTNSCAATGCHDLCSTQDNKPLLKENFTHPANPDLGYPEGTIVTTTGSWRMRYSQSHTYSRMSYSNDVGATLAVTFNGMRVELIADRDPYRGMGEVWIDGALVGTVDLYAPTTTYQATVFESDALESGVHTIQVKVLGTKNPAARANYFTVDAFEVYCSMPESVAPECVTCHEEQASNHGGSFDHVATQTVDAAYPSTSITCTQCHSMSMWAEHTRVSSKTKAASCSACHTTYADFTLDTYAGTCTESPCHQVANGQDPHNYTDAAALIDANHVAPEDAATAECRACHGENLSVIHDDSNSSRALNASLDGIGSTGPDFVTSCLTCHGTDSYPTTADCTDSGCHVGSGVVSMATHPAPAHDGSNTNDGVLRTGSLSCSTCHLLELTAEHGKSSSVTDPGGVTIGCPECHGAAYFPNSWLETPGTTNTCDACHDPAGAADAGLPHEASEYTAKHDWTATMGGSCGGCHNVAMIDFIHTDPLNAGVTIPRGSSCVSCHVEPDTVPTVTSCYDCHEEHSINDSHLTATEELESDNADCRACHTSFGSLVQHVTRGMDGGCAGCHDRTDAMLDDYLQDNYSARCTDCHNSTMDLDGAGPAPYDYATYDPNHYDPYLANHTATGMDTAIANKTCTSCHATSLKAEHVFTLSSGAVDCLDCHTMSLPINAKSVILANWENGACGDCHGSNHGAVGLSVHDLAASATTLGCSASGCHEANTGDIATLHLTAADAGSNTSCNVCHTSADTSLATVSGCDSAGCHTAAAHDMTKHEVSTDSGGCLGCHGDDGEPADDVLGVHAGCATCHGNATYPGITSGKTSDCVDCHAAGIVPEPNAGSGGDYDTYDSNHYVGTEATHTVSAAQGAAMYDGFACTACHETEMKPEHFKATSAFPDTPGTYADKCVDCHESEVDSFVGAWDDTCTSCHATNHTDRAAKHDATGVGNADGCYADGDMGGLACHDISDVAALHDNSATHSDTTADTDRCATCHLDDSAVPTKLGCDSVGCHGATQPDSHLHGANQVDSRYDDSDETGCSGSGQGCHWMDYSNYLGGHPFGSCGYTACHNSADHWDAAFDNDNACQDCHDGSYEYALDTVALKAASPDGHYGETVHTATGSGALVDAGGTTSAACSVCHDSVDTGGLDGLYYQHQGLQTLGDTTCYGCHNATEAVQTLVTDAVLDDACADCHATAVLPGLEQHGTTVGAASGSSVDGCTDGCHGADLHEIHKGNGVGDDPACTVCHDDEKQGWNPTDTTCGANGACHKTDAHDPAAHTLDAGNDDGSCIDCHESTDIRVVHSGDCTMCHNAGDNLGASNTADCVDCHDGDTAGGDAYYDSADNPVHLDHYTDLNASSHTEADDISGGATWGTTTYGHTLDYYFTGGATADTTGNAYERPCGDCHTTDLYTEHTKSTIDFALGSYSNECVACHEIVVDGWGATAWDLTCSGSTDCHDVTAANLHFGVDTSRSWTSKHDATSWTLTDGGSDCGDTIGGFGGSGSGGVDTAGASCSNNPNGTECHNVTDVADIHAQLANDGCSVCHTDNTDHPTIKNCQASGCHVGVNIDEHDAHHDTNFVSATFDTAFETAWCESCHIGSGGTAGVDGIDDEHEVLDAYDSTPCSMCHKKGTDTGGAAAVTQANTIATIGSRGSGEAICDDCHKTFTKERPHVQRDQVDGKQFSAATAWSGHRIYASNIRTGPTWMSPTWGAYSTARPPLAEFLQSAWQDYAQMVTCDDCHVADTPAAPHAGTMQISGNSSYPDAYSSAELASSDAQGISNNSICAKCHDLNGTNTSFAEENYSHSRHAPYTTNSCIDCHAQVPHQTKHFRMIGMNDEGNLGSTPGFGMSGMRAKTITDPAIAWAKSDCDVGCTTKHPARTYSDWTNP